MEPLRIAIVGLGRHATWAVEKAIEQRSTRWRLVAGCDIREEARQPLAQRGLPVYADYRDLFARESLDAVYLCTPCDAHVAPALAALVRGLHVVCEKPLAEHAADCEPLRAAVADTGKTFTTVFETRYHPGYRTLRERVVSGALGRVEAIHYQHCWDGHKVAGDLGARRARLIEHTGALDCGIHKLDNARYLMGGDWSAISALGSWFGEPTRHAPHIAFMGRLSSGPLVTLAMSFAYTAYIEPRVQSNVLTVVGTSGVANEFSDGITTPGIDLVTATGRETILNAHVTHDIAIGWLLDDLAATIADGTPRPAALATLEDGIVAQRAVDEALRQCLAEREACAP